MKLKTIKKITGKIEVATGLHIGAGNDSLEIGGMDNPVVKNPNTGEPYIPGSSLKGKIRYLLEWKYNKIGRDKNTGNINGDPCNCGKPDCFICRIFGCSDSKNRQNNADKLGPTRIIFRDAEFSKDNNIEEVIIEEKHENTIDRVNASANPRSMERVVQGVKFDFELIYKVYDLGDSGKTDEDNFDKVIEGLGLLELDYLGGGGSRGNGKIKFIDLVDENGKKIVPSEKVKFQ
ncbi:MAG: type III-A CRISPR-associated RAMP protein Csm3 [Spirochaetales bacterium]|jgi:CRISPR-associated protein Csm3|nr:type III-A CRISPR-associated RAMP protein Csm3 [Exilispira sp.]NMC66633.1 type III-A CRISPR-associated RAMP protein Csm3 [Spirochaetales bacterium]